MNEADRKCDAWCLSEQICRKQALLCQCGQSILHRSMQHIAPFLHASLCIEPREISSGQEGFHTHLGLGQVELLRWRPGNQASKSIAFDDSKLLLLLFVSRAVKLVQVAAGIVGQLRAWPCLK